MKPRIIATATVMGLLLALSAGDLFAAGRGNGGKGGGAGNRNGTCATGTTATTRPAGSQRRDGTFLSTGTTANGSTSRPGNGNGLQDGSRLNVSTGATPPTAE